MSTNGKRATIEYQEKESDAFVFKVHKNKKILKAKSETFLLKSF